MPEETTRTKLHIVPSQRREQMSLRDFIEPGTQGMLFPAPRQGLMVFVRFPDVTEQEFSEALKGAMPSYVIELRASPRFDIGGLNRQLAFQAFKHLNITYMDLTSTLMGQMNSEALIYRLREFLQNYKLKFDRPIMFLVNRIESDENLVSMVLAAISDTGTQPKYVLEVPKFERQISSDYQLVAL